MTPIDWTVHEAAKPKHRACLVSGRQSEHAGAAGVVIVVDEVVEVWTQAKRTAAGGRHCNLRAICDAVKVDRLVN
jgi:hypothetical protein